MVNSNFNQFIKNVTALIALSVVLLNPISIWGQVSEEGGENNFSACPCYGQYGESYNVGTGTGIPKLSDFLGSHPIGGSFSGTLLVFGIFKIDMDFELNGATVIMCEGAELQVVNRASFKVMNQSVIRECVKPWNRILITPFSKIDVRNSTIRMADKAIELEGYSWVRNIENSNFVNNRIGIYTAPGSMKQIFQGWAIEGNIFLGDADIDKNRAHTGIELNNTVGFKIGTNADRLQNEFQHLEKGIKINNCRSVQVYGANVFDLRGEKIGIESLRSDNTIIKHSKIKEPVYGILGDGSSLKIIDNDIIDCEDTGILNHADSRPNLWALVEDNIVSTFNEENRIFSTSGISFYFLGESDEKIEIVNNIINVKGFGPAMSNGISVLGNSCCINVIENRISSIIPLNPIGEPKYQGIRLDNRKNKDSYIFGNIINFSANIGHSVGISMSENDVLVSENTLTGGGISTWGIGIEFNNSQNCNFSCNTVNEFEYGVRTAHFPNTNISLQTTTFGKHKIGLSIFESELGIPQPHHGNNWEDSDCSEDYANFDLPPGIPLAIFDNNRFTSNYDKIPNCTMTSTQCHDEISVSQNSIQLDPKDWFVFNDFKSDIELCASAGSCGDDDDGVIVITDDDLDTPILPPGGTPKAAGYFWMKKQNLFQKLKKYPQLLNQYSVIDAFYSASDAGVLGELYEVRESIDNLYKPSTGTIDLLNNLQIQIDNYIVQIEAMQESLNNEPQNEAYWTEQIESTFEAEKLLIEQYNEVINNVKETGLNQIPGIIALNEAVIATEIYETNEVLINDVYLNTVLKGVYEFTIEQKNTVEFVADQCPSSGGFSVYQARNLRNLYEYVVYDDKANCEETPIEGRRQIKAPKVQIGIHPNPVNSLFSVRLEQPLERTAEILITNTLGEVISKTQEPEGLSYFEINSSGWTSGVYFIQIYSGDERILSEKVIKN